MKRIRKFKGYSKNRSLSYRLIKKSTSKKKLKDIGSAHSNYRIIKCSGGWALYVYN